MIQSKNIYHDMIEEIEDYAILLIDVEGNVVNWNKGAEKIKGYTAKEIIGKNFHLFYTPEDRERGIPEKLIKKAALKGKASDEGWRVRKDGTCFWGSILITAIHDENKKVIGFSKVTRDLTDKKNVAETERNLLQTKAGLMKLFNVSPSGMILADIESGKLLEVNQTFLTIFGYKREETIGYTADELGFVSNETQVKSFSKLKEQGYLKNENVPACTKEGKKIDTIFSVELLEMEGKPCFLCIFHDITEMKEMERKVVESELKYRSIIEEAGDVLYTSDAQGKFTYINQRVKELTEYSMEELLGMHFSILIAPEWQEKVRSEYQLQFKNKVHETVMEFLIHTKTGKEKWVEQVVIMQLENASIKGFQCIVRDITERKKASLLLAEQKKIIEQKNKDILDSINYAKNIQDAIFPPEELVKELLPQSFVLLKPKDIISGDFYWVEKFDTKTYIAAVDCTGHGVPGALLSIVGYNLLSKSINEHGHTKPNEILNELSIGISKTLRQTIQNPGISDTMDIALCSIDRVTNMLEYAGAYNPLYLIRKNELIVLQADKFPVGVSLSGELQKFTNHQMLLEKGDMIYLFSDGYSDQFGGPKGKKLKDKGFKDILLSIHQLPLTEQKHSLNKIIEEWKWMSEEQTDDILIIGIRI
jgi:PAS domain S-box-containing protein